MVSSLISQANSLQFIDLKDIKPRTEVIERLWKVMNELTRNNQVFKTFNEFKEKIHTLRTMESRRQW